MRLKWNLTWTNPLLIPIIIKSADGAASCPPTQSNSPCDEVTRTLRLIEFEFPIRLRWNEWFGYSKSTLFSYFWWMSGSLKRRKLSPENEGVRIESPTRLRQPLPPHPIGHSQTYVSNLGLQRPYPHGEFRQAWSQFSTFTPEIADDKSSMGRPFMITLKY